MANTIFLSICLLLIFRQPTWATPVPQDDLESLFAPPPDPTWTPASETTLQPSPTSPTNTIAPPEDLSGTDDEPVANTALSRKFVDSRCTPAQQAIIENAWYEASLLDEASKKYVPNGAFSTAYINHFGTIVASTGSWWPWDQNYRKIIGDNLNRRHALETDNAPSNAYLYYYCYDWNNDCSPGKVGYSITKVGLWWYNHYITWCPLFFDERVPTLAKAISEISNLPNSAEEKNILEPFYYTTAASMVSRLQKQQFQFPLHYGICDSYNVPNSLHFSVSISLFQISALSSYRVEFRWNSTANLHISSTTRHGTCATPFPIQ